MLCNLFYSCWKEGRNWQPRQNRTVYITEDADDPNGEGWCHLRLNWRAEKVSEFFQTLDSRASANRKEFMKERTKRTSSGESRKRAPTDAPAWAIKSPVATRAIRGAAAASRRARGCGGIRTRGGGRDNGSRRLEANSTSARREITFSAQDVLDSISN